MATMGYNIYQALTTVHSAWQDISLGNTPKILEAIVGDLTANKDKGKQAPYVQCHQQPDPRKEQQLVWLGLRKTMSSGEPPAAPAAQQEE